MTKNIQNGRNILAFALSGVMLQVTVTSSVSASENNNLYVEKPYLFKTSYSDSDAQSNGFWGWIAIGGATFLLLQSMSSDDDDRASDGGPPGKDSPAGGLGVSAATFKQSNSASSTKGRLLEIAPQHGLFLSVGNSELDLKGSSGTSSETKFTIGYDRRFDSKAVVGALIDRAQSEIDFDDVSTTQDENRLSAFVFLSYQFSPSSSLYSYAGFDRLEKDTNRFLAVNSPSALGSADGNGYSLGLSLSHDFPNYKGLQPTVLAELDYSSSTFKGYEERGSSIDLLNYPEQTNDSLTVSLGGGLSTAISLSNGVFVPGFNVKLINGLKTEGEEIEVSSIDGSTSELVSTSESDEFHVQFSANASFVLQNGVQLFANYDRVFEHEFFDRNRFSLGGRMEF